MVQSNEKLPDCNQNMEQSVEPHNDFFSAQFLLPFNVPGTHQVIIETKLVDELGQSWNLGVKTHLNIKSFEDGRHQNTRGSVTR